MKIVDEPNALSADKFYQAPEILCSQEPESLSSLHFIENRLSKLVRTAIDKELISLNRGAEILRLNTKTMREVASSWV